MLHICRIVAALDLPSELRTKTAGQNPVPFLDELPPQMIASGFLDLWQPRAFRLLFRIILRVVDLTDMLPPAVGARLNSREEPRLVGLVVWPSESQDCLHLH